MELHFGTITAESPGLDRGCTFTVEYPVVHCIQNLSDGQSDVIDDEGVVVQDQPRISHLLSFPPSKDSLTSVGEHDIERPDLSSPPMKSLSKVLVVDDSAPSRKMLSRCGNLTSS